MAEPAKKMHGSLRQIGMHVMVIDRNIVNMTENYKRQRPSVMHSRRQTCLNSSWPLVDGERTIFGGRAMVNKFSVF